MPREDQLGILRSGTHLVSRREDVAEHRLIAGLRPTSLNRLCAVGHQPGSCGEIKPRDLAPTLVAGNTRVVVDVLHCAEIRRGQYSSAPAHDTGEAMEQEPIGPSAICAKDSRTKTVLSGVIEFRRFDESSRRSRLP